MKRLIKDKAGSYTPPNNTDSAVFQIPKTKPGVTPDVVTMENQRMNSQASYKEVGNAIPIEETYSLKKSSEKLGKLYPVLKDSKGNIIDGRHRKEVDPHWPSLTCHDIDSPIKLHLARLTANFCRRTVPKEELEENIGFLIGAGLKPEKIAEETGISLRTVYNYMPQVLKDKVKVDAGRKGGEVAARLHQTVKTQDTPQPLQQVEEHVKELLVTCASCNRQVSKIDAKPWKNKHLCLECWNDLPETYKRVARIPKPQNQVLTPSSVEAWKDKAARMRSSPSKFDEAMLIRLQNNVKLRENGWKVEFQKQYVKVLCVSDVTLTNPKQAREIMCFFDHPETYKHPEKDEERRLEAASIHHTESLPLPYKACTDKEGIRCENRILEALEV